MEPPGPRLYCHNAMTSPIGQPVRRKEDGRLLTGRGRYVADLQLPGLLHAAIVRSPHAHARVERVDARRALAQPGVVAVLTIAELPECAAAVPPLVASLRFRAYAQPALAGPEVRHAGEAVAVVVADDTYRAADAGEAVEVQYAVLRATAGVADAQAPDAPRVSSEWPDNVAGPAEGAVGDVARGFAQAHEVVEARLSVPRIAAMPIEPRGVVAQPDAPDGRLTVWSSTQVPFAVRAAVAAALGLAEEQVRVIAPDVGGGFGAKGHVYPEDVLIPAAARRLAMDPAELRRRNLIRLDEMPYTTGLRYRDGVPIVYDKADYRAAFDRLLGLFGYDRWRDEQKARRAAPHPIGIGLSAYVEGTGIGPFEGADVRIDPSGTIYLHIGVSSQGQAHETTLAQVCAAELGGDYERVVVVGGDTSVVGFGNGTIASRVAAVAGPAVARSAREVARKAKLVAGELLECAPADIVLAGGRASVVGMADRFVELGALARASLRSRALIRQTTEPGLHACAFFRPETVTWAFGAHACAVEVDVETGAVRILRYAAVHDCGRPLNPMIVEGQLHGGIAQGIGAALAEELIYDGDGQLLTGSLMEYGVPKADQVPFFDVVPLDFPSMRNELGIKGVGESGIISPVPAIANAVEDALADRGVEITRVPLTAASVWAALRDARRRRPVPPEPLPRGRPGTSVERLDLRRALETVPREARVLLALHYVNGLGYRELAAIRGISVNTVKSQLARGKAILRRALED